jgi:ABC-type transport system substrate-binding protein
MALQDAINRSALIQALLSGYGTQTEGPIPLGMPGSNGSIKQLSYNLQNAENLLATAGFPNGTGIRTLAFDILSDPFSSTVAQAIQSAWAKIGVSVKINVLTGTQVNSILLEAQPRGSDYPDLLLLSFSPDYAYPDDYATNILNINSIIDQSNLNDTLINKWTNQLLTTTSAQQLAQLGQNITLREQSLVSNIWLWQAGPGVPAYTSSVQFVHPVWNPMTFGFNYSNIYLSQ